MKRASYRQSVHWIATLNYNKYTCDLFVVFIADIFNVPLHKVARDVALRRMSLNISPPKVL